MTGRAQPAAVKFCNTIYILVWLHTVSAEREFRIVGLLPDQNDAFVQQWNPLREYLDREVGSKFSPRIFFSLRSKEAYTLAQFDSADNHDFVYTHPNMIACLEAEFLYNPVATVQNIRSGVAGLSHFGGVLFVRNNRTDLNMISDLKDRTVTVSNFKLMQQEYQVFEDNGVSLFADTAQVRFTTKTDAEIMQDVLHGRTDAAFARSDVLHSADLSVRQHLRVLQPRNNMTMGGRPYPFPTTSELYPEFGLLAAEHVPWDVQAEVMSALLRLGASSLETTSAGISVFQPALSYSAVRDLHQRLGLMSLDPESNRWRCVRAEGVWDNVVCPAGTFKQPPHKMEAGCADAGLSCPSDQQCVCRPCTTGEEVAVSASVTRHKENGDMDTTAPVQCHHMQLCATAQQNDVITIRLVDNLLREENEMRWQLHQQGVFSSGTGAAVYTDRAEFAFEYEFTLTSQREGIHILELFLGGDPVASSPVMLQVARANCSAHREANQHGDCVCSGSSIAVGSSCLSLAVVLVVCAAVLLVAAAAGVLMYRHVRSKHEDALWVIHPNDLHFTSPLEVLGRGSFGLVVAAEYRKTTVAVKRVIPPSVSGGDGMVRRMSRVLGNDLDGQRELLDKMFLPTTSTSSPPTDRRPSLAESSFSHLPSLPALPSGVAASPLSRRGSASVWPLDAAAAAAAAAAHHCEQQQWSLLRVLQALRCVPTERSRQRSAFMEEMRRIARMRHPCVTTVMGAVVAAGHEPMLVMEVMEHGSLQSLVGNQTVELTGELLIPILCHVAQGMSFLHHYPVVHGDLRAANVLVDAQFRGKVADFGLASKRQGGGKGPVGTPYWMAPEVLKGGENTAASDVYAFGVTLWECYARAEPYAGEDPTTVLSEIVAERTTVEGEVAGDKRPEVSAGWAAEVAVIMRACWHRSAELRPPFDEVHRMLKTLDTATMGPPSTHARIGSIRPAQERIASGGVGRVESAHGRRVLYDVFPKHVADKLLAGDKVPAEHRSEVTIFFSDIVGFTTIASTQSPTSVSDMLDRLYTKLDDVSHRLGVFKVETIGDAYMAVTNLVEDQAADHCLRIASFAVEAIRAAADTLIDPDNPALGSIHLRVGLHSGPVVANVVGARNPRYCLFGDTVNTASRMESNSQPGRIHCSEPCAKILRKQLAGGSIGNGLNTGLDLRCRGEMDIKGKGKMHTFWVAAAKSAEPVTVTGTDVPIPGPTSAQLNECDEPVHPHRPQEI